MQRVRIERKSDYTIRLASPSDKEAVKDFFKENIWKSKDADTLYDWKYEKNPMGMLVAPLGINSEGKIIAAAYFMPWKLAYENKAIGACQWVDLYVDLSYRGQPIPSEQLKLALDTTRRLGSPICFAFPNNNSVPVHKKNSAIYLGSIMRYTKPLKAGYLIERKIKSPLLSSIVSFFANIALTLSSKDTYLFNAHTYEVDTVSTCGADYDDFWRAYSRSLGKIMSYKDSSYMNWKYVNTPNAHRSLYLARSNGKVAGFVVLESAGKIGYVVDIGALDDSSLDYLLAYAIKHFRKEGKDSVVFVALEHNAYINTFERYGFVKRPEEKHIYMYLDETMENKEYVTDAKNWFMTIGDCDIEAL